MTMYSAPTDFSQFCAATIRRNLHLIQIKVHILERVFCCNAKKLDK